MANFGMGHPTYNPEGAAKASDDKKWFETTIAFNSKADCFDPSKLLTNSGTIASGKSGHKAGKYADAIYASSVQDLRMSSKKLPLKEIREKYKRMAIAGEVRGFEGVPFTVVINSASAVGFTSRDYNRFSINATNGVKVKIGAVCTVADAVGVKKTTVVQVNERLDGDYDIITDLKYNIGAMAEYVAIANKQPHKQANPTWTDIIGSPENIAATFPDGVEGQWIPVIPAVTNTFPLNRKSTDTVANRLTSTDEGATWVSQNVTLNTTTNTVGYSGTDTTINLVHYETQAHFTQNDVNSKVLDLGGVFASGSIGVFTGGLIVSSLIGKVPNTSYAGHHGFYNVTLEGGYNNFSKRGVFMFGAGASMVGQSPSHTSLLFPSVSSPHVKAFDYLSSENNVAKLCYAYKEMKFDGTWGDNNKFEIYNQSAVITDDNGNSIKVGTSSFDTQYFISEE